MPAPSAQIFAFLEAPHILRTEPQVTLRVAGPGDAAAIRTLYHAARESEFRPLGLPEPMLATLLDGQLRAQHMGYASQYPDLATYVLAGARDEPLVGRLMLAQDGNGGLPAALRIVDLLIAAPWRGRGLGGAVLGLAAAAARAASLDALRLEVAVDNVGARRLYERLGFVADAGKTDSAGLHVAMRKRLSRAVCAR
jgi:RimJ/RimL family protein N-acetyltransferase